MNTKRIQKGVGSVLGFLAVLVLFVQGFVVVAASHDGEEPATIRDLASVDELKAVFNEDKGDPRLLLLLSPT